MFLNFSGNRKADYLVPFDNPVWQWDIINSLLSVIFGSKDTDCTFSVMLLKVMQFVTSWYVQCSVIFYCIRYLSYG